MDDSTKLTRKLENTPIGNCLAFAGHAGLSRTGRLIGEAFLRDHADSTPDRILNTYFELNTRIWEVSQTAGDGFGRVVGKFVANAQMKSIAVNS